MIADKRTYSDAELDSALLTSTAEAIAFLKESNTRLNKRLVKQTALLAALEKMEK